MADSSRNGAPVLAPTQTQSTSMLADCCMQRRWEWGTTAAMGKQWPPWLVGHSLASFSKLLLSGYSVGGTNEWIYY
jgi:hypothetical protein